jgi:hypothetical protein
MQNIYETHRPLLSESIGEQGSFTWMSDGSRKHFVQLLLLDFFQKHINLLATTLKHISMVEIPQGRYASIVSPAMEEFCARSKYAARLVENAKDLKSPVEYIDSNLNIGGTQPLPADLQEHLIGLRFRCTQVVDIATRLVEMHQQDLKAFQDTQSIHESEGVKRLTILAAIFLPLSLSSSMLAMSTRFVDLHLLLFDFLGVFVLLGSIAICLYFMVIVFIKILKAM